MGPSTRRQGADWTALKRSGHYRGSRVKPPKFWMVVNWRYQTEHRIDEWWRDHPGASVKEIARALGMSPNQVQHHASRMRERWRRELQLHLEAIRSRM